MYSTKCLSNEGCVLLEVENPVDKNDLVRFKDQYGREQKPYEGLENMKKISSNEIIMDDPKDDMGQKFKFENVEVTIEKHLNLNKVLKENSETIFAVIEKGLIDLDYSIEKNIKNLSDFYNKDFSSITVCILDRPRHIKIIDKLKELKVNIKLITDGDVLGALYVSNPKYNVDMFLGIGGGPEGVLAACALDAYDCHFQGRFIFDNKKDINEAKNMGIVDLDKKYELKEIVKGDSIFCATGITSSEFLTGISLDHNSYQSQSLITHKSSNYKKVVNLVKSIDE